MDAVGSEDEPSPTLNLHPSRHLQASSPSPSPTPLLPSTRCSGYGIYIPPQSSAPPSAPGNITAYLCSGSPVPQASHDVVNTAQSEAGTGGITPVTTLLLSAALANAGANVTRTLIVGSDPLPSSINVSTLPGLVRTPVLSAAGGREENVTRKGDLFPAGVAGNVAQIGVLLNAIGPVGTAELLNGTVCTSVSSAAPTPSRTPSPSRAASPSPSPGATLGGGTCACPLDRTGDRCQHARHFQCAVVLADPLYHACVASNGAGFTAPTASPAHSLGLGTSGMGGAGAAAASHLVDLGTGSGVAVPLAAEYALDSGTMYGLSYARTLPRPVMGSNQQGKSGYRPTVPGDPPCLFLNVSHVRRVVEALDPAVPSFIPLHFRVRCSWLTSNVSTMGTPGSSTLAATTVTSDPLGVLYHAKPYSPYNTTADVLQEYASGPSSYSGFRQPLVLGQPTFSDSDPQPTADIVLCNGTELTDGGLQLLLASLGYSDANSTLPGPPPYYGLPCLESSFLPFYTVPFTAAPGIGDVQSREVIRAASLPGATFTLSRGRSLPLALRVRPINPTWLTSSAGLTLAPLPYEALTGGVDVPVYMDARALLEVGPYSSKRTNKARNAVSSEGLPLDPSRAFTLWPAGRMYLEAKVVMAPQGVDTGAATSMYARSSRDDTAPMTEDSIRRAFGARGTLPGLAASSTNAYSEYSLLLLSNVHGLTLDDSAWTMPSAASPSRQRLALGLGLGIPAVILALVGWWVCSVMYGRWDKRRQGSGDLSHPLLQSSATVTASSAESSHVE